jgi:hypothetical protein
MQDEDNIESFSLIQAIPRRRSILPGNRYVLSRERQIEIPDSSG